MSVSTPPPSRLIKRLGDHRIAQVMCGNQHCIALSKGRKDFISLVFFVRRCVNEPCCSFPWRWPAVHVGSEHQRSARTGEGRAQQAVSTAPQVSGRDSAGKDHRGRRPQLCPLSVWSCVWMGQEQSWTTGSQWYSRYRRLVEDNQYWMFNAYSFGFLCTIYVVSNKKAIILLCGFPAGRKWCWVIHWPSFFFWKYLMRILEKSKLHSFFGLGNQ